MSNENVVGIFGRWVIKIVNTHRYHIVGMSPNAFLASSLITYKIGYIERGRVGMGCVLQVIRGVLASIKDFCYLRGRLVFF